MLRVLFSATDAGKAAKWQSLPFLDGMPETIVMSRQTMLKRIFEEPRYVVAAVGGLVAIQGVIFTLIDVGVFSVSMTMLGLAVAVGGLHVEARPVLTRVSNNVPVFLGQIKETIKEKFEEFKEARARQAEERELQKRRERASANRPKLSPTFVSANLTPTSLPVLRPEEEFISPANLIEAHAATNEPGAMPATFVSATPTPEDILELEAVEEFNPVSDIGRREVLTAKTKVEMESHRAKYQEDMASARLALRKGQHDEAVTIAASSWMYIDGMMQFERKYENREFSNIEAIDVVLDFAPLLFHSQVLDDLESLLKSQRRIDRDASDDLAGSLANARARMWDAYRLWNHIERNDECRQDELRTALGGDQDQWRSIAEAWERFGLILRISDRNSYRLSIATRIDGEALAKCPSCGAMIKGSMYKLLDAIDCPKCRAKGIFVFLSRLPGVSK